MQNLWWQTVAVLELIAITLILVFWLRNPPASAAYARMQNRFGSTSASKSTSIIPFGQAIGRHNWFPDTTQNPFVYHLDMVYYINLDSRTDRKASIENELARLGVPNGKITRIPGVIASHGALGCTKSHINALRDAISHGYRNCVVLEDDFVLKASGPVVIDTISRFFRSSIRWDVVMLSAFVREFTPTSFDFIARTNNAQTTAGYMVHGRFFHTLLRNFEESEAGFAPGVVEYCIDQHWKQLQQTAHWYVFCPVIGYQADGYSDIEHRDVAYYDKVELPMQLPKYKHVILSKTCKPRLDRIVQQQTAVRDAVKDGMPVCIYHFYGQPDLETDFSVDETTHIVALKCEDDYMNLCHKFGLMLRFADSMLRNNRCFNDVNGFMSTDEDIVLVVPDFYVAMERRSVEPFWGFLTTCTVDRSWHFKVKYDESALVKSTVDSRYPSLLKIPVELLPISYVAGGAAYMRTEYIAELSQMNDLFSPFPGTDAQLLEYYDKEKHMFVGLPAFQDHNCGAAMLRLGVTPVMVDDVQKSFHWE